MRRDYSKDSILVIHGLACKSPQVFLFADLHVIIEMQSTMCIGIRILSTFIIVITLPILVNINKFSTVLGKPSPLFVFLGNTECSILHVETHHPILYTCKNTSSCPILYTCRNTSLCPILYTCRNTSLTFSSAVNLYH